MLSLCTNIKISHSVRNISKAICHFHRFIIQWILTPQNLESLTKFNLPKPTERYTQNSILHNCNGRIAFARIFKKSFFSFVRIQSFHLHEKINISFALFLKLPGNDILP